MTEEAYLEAEEKATVRHEYVDGHVFAMTGATVAHNIICGNMFAFIHGSVRGSGCRAYANDMKVRVRAAKSYYYPDIMVSCEPVDGKSVFRDVPTLLVEVLSPSTRSVDQREKLVAYKKLASVKEYVIVYQDRQRIEVHRRERDGEWELIVLSGEEDLILESLPGGSLAIPFATIYEGYNPPTRVKEDEGYCEMNLQFMEKCPETIW
jgi:Uma2 family endonuclease